MSLAGKHVLVTRAIHQQAELARLLAAQGAIPVLYPCIAIAPPANPQALSKAVEQLLAGYFEWLIVTSSNTVAALTPLLNGKKIPAKIAAIGPATAHAILNQWGQYSVALPDQYHSEGLGEALSIGTRDRILLPHSAQADNDLIHLFDSKGAQVTTITAYQTIQGSGGADLTNVRLDALTFTSPTTIRYFIERIGQDGLPLARFEELPCACLGQKTAHALTFSQQILCPPLATLPALVQTLADYFEESHA